MVVLRNLYSKITHKWPMFVIYGDGTDQLLYYVMYCKITHTWLYM